MVDTITLKEVYPPSGHVQRLYCDACKGHLDLAYADYRKLVSGVDITIKGLPVLRCKKCAEDYMPDHSRFAIIRHHELATLRGSNAVQVTRKPLEKTFPLPKVSFLYDADDYYYIPGLSREWDDGFLTPVFFNKKVLLKYDLDPAYKVSFASTTYGTIDMESAYISFGINKNGKVIMWLGDIGKLPESEQYYLRSENVPSDHSIGCEFYDGQIECIYTPHSREQHLFAARSSFFEACAAKFGTKVAHLDAEVLDLALAFNSPVIDSEQTRKRVADTLNRIYVESIDSAALGNIMVRAGLDPKTLGGLKRLQAALGTLALGDDVATLLSPFFVLYDLRVAYSHLGSSDSTAAKLKTVTDRLGLEDEAGLLTIYDALVASLTASLETLTALLKSASGMSTTGPPNVEDNSMFEESLKALPAGRVALERWQTPAAFIAKVEELAAPIKSDKLFNLADVAFLLDAMVLAEFIKFRPVERVRLVGQTAQWPDGQIGSPKVHVNIEITEVLEEGRRRGDEYREAKKAEKETSEDWRTRALTIPGQLEKAIERKIAKAYAGKCKFVIYLNMSTYGILQKETEAAIAAVKAKYADKFEEICVLWQEKLL